MFRAGAQRSLSPFASVGPNDIPDWSDSRSGRKFGEIAMMQIADGSGLNMSGADAAAVRDPRHIRK
jgi:hypothetical protein